MKRRKQIYAFIFFVIVMLSLLLTIYPFAIMVSGSFKTQTEMNRYPLRLIPQEPTIENYLVLFDKIPFWRQFGNSAFVALTSAVGSMLLTGLVAYGFTRFEFRGKSGLFGFVLATMMIPGQVLMVPLFIVYRNVGLFGTYVPLIVPFLCGASGIFLVRQVMMQVPIDLYESATIDGCGEMRIYLTIALPLSSAGVGIQGVLTFMAVWNDFMTPLIYLNSEARYTLSLGLMRLQDFYNIDYGTPLAGAFLSCLPILAILTLVGQKYFVQGLTAGAVKG